VDAELGVVADEGTVSPIGRRSGMAAAAHMGDDEGVVAARKGGVEDVANMRRNRE
jgi:hypothetical protein